MNSTTSTRFSLRFLRGSTPFVYEYDPWLAAVQQLDPEAVLAEITDQDIEAYTVSGAASDCIALSLTDAAALRLRGQGGAATQATVLLEAPVIVRLDGILLYAAKEYAPYGAAALRIPVVHLEQIDKRQLRVCGSLMPMGPEATRRIDLPELRSFFRSLGRLKLK